MSDGARQPSGTSPHREALADLIVNIVAPTVVLLFFSGDDMLGPVVGLVVALAFPVAHAVGSMVMAGGVSGLSVIAFVSVLLTGGIGLLELDPRWFALKEGAIPLLFAMGAAASLATPWPLAEVMLGRVLDHGVVRAALEERGTAARYAARLRRFTWHLAGIFALSGPVTWALARYVVTSPTGSAAFNAELGWFTTLSFVVVLVPSTLLMALALQTLVRGIEDDTGKDLDDILVL